MERLVSVITVNYNGIKFLEPCLSSLFKVDKNGFSLEIIVVDNLSKDGSIDFVKRRFPETKIIENDINNYTKALNLGIRNSKGGYIAFLNNDTVVEENWLKGLMDVMNRDKKIGAVQSKVLFSDGKTINSVGGEEVEDFYFKDVGFGEKDVGRYNEVKERKFFSGGSVLFKRECLESVGGFDEDFVMYMEDIDYSFRCRDRGWKLFYSPGSVIYHKFHGTASSKLCDYFCSRNRLLLLGKRFPLRLPQAVKTSHFYLNKELGNLYHSLIQTCKKLIEHNDTETSKKTLDKLKDVVVEVFGHRKAYNFYSQLEVVSGLRKIRIGIYDHAFHFAGGGQRYVAKLAEALQDRCDITYIVNKEITLEKYKEWFDIDLSRCKLKIIRIPFYERIGTHFIDEGMVINESTNPFDVISKESLYYDIFINANMLGKVKPLSGLSIFMCHFPDREKEKFFSVDQYDYLITNSDYTSFWVKKRWGLNPTLRLYPPVDMYNSLNGEDKEKVILSVARFEPGGSKKQIETIKAFNNLCKRNKNVKNGWRLILAGGSSKDNLYLDRVKHEIDYSKANIELMPNLTNLEIMKLYNEACIFWHACGLNENDPHLIEHFGMTTVEAMQNHCVPIVIDGGGQREIVEHGVSGFLFKTIKELELYTLKIINDEGLRKKIARKAYERSHSFTSAIFKKRLLEFFSNVENRLRGGEALEVLDKRAKIFLKNGLQLGRGYFNLVERKDGQLIVDGWMLLPEQKFDNFFVFVNKRYICKTPIIERENVAKTFPFISHAKYSGFSASVQINNKEAEGLIDICLIGMANGEPIAKMETWYSKKVSFDMSVPTHLMKRVANTENSSFFGASSFKSFRDYWERILKYIDQKQISTMLDWGCGCGRLTGIFRNLTEIPEIHGCDLDREAIDWCETCISKVRFCVIPLVPPTQYPDNYFDVAIGNSVLTHLTKDTQLLWLEELKRIIAPGGLLLVSVHGEFAAYFSFPNSIKDIFKNGIYDKTLDTNLNNIVPPGYYRGTFQSQQYTKEVFGKYFEILEYVERGSLNYQDLIVMKKC